MDSSDEWEEEEQCLLVDLHGILEPDFLQKAEGNCKVLGIGTENPYLQVDGYTFSGKYVAPIGSYLIFKEKNPTGETEKNQETDYAKLEYVACLDKKLDVNRTFVSPKVSEDANSADKSNGSIAPANQQGSQENPNQDNDEILAVSDGPDAMETSSVVT